jgi:hypothetical protein
MVERAETASIPSSLGSKSEEPCKVAWVMSCDSLREPSLIVSNGNGGRIMLLILAALFIAFWITFLYAACVVSGNADDMARKMIPNLVL